MTQTASSQKADGKLHFPCSIWALVNAMVKMAWDYYQDKNKAGKYIRRPKTFTCPMCKKRLLEQKKSPVLADRASKNIVIFFKKDSGRIAVCHTCGYTKREKVAACHTEVATQTIPAEPTTVNSCGCGNQLPAGRKKFCYSCRPQEGQPIARVTSM